MINEIGLLRGVVVQFPPEDIYACDEGYGNAKRRDGRPGPTESPRGCVFHSWESLFGNTVLCQGKTLAT